MSRPRIHQVLVGAVEGDAITQMSLALRESLCEHAESQVFADSILSESLEGAARPIADLPPAGEIDLLVYHSSIGHEPIHSLLHRHPGKIAVVYHNITPPEFYESYNPEFAALLRSGREELVWLSERSSLMIADSEFNAAELRALGCMNVETVPAGLMPSRLLDEPLDGPMIRDIKSRFANGYALVIGQVLPHKRIEQTVEAVHLLNSTYHHGLGLVICGAQRQGEYSVSVWEHIKSLPFVGVHMTGAVSDRHLGTLLKGARIYLGMSDHEGLCLPPVEAMAAGVPVVIKGAGAIPETVGNGALVIGAGEGPMMAAEAMHEVLTNTSLRSRMVTNGFARVRELESRDDTPRAARLLLDLVA